MRRNSLWFALALCALLPGVAAAATCTPTGFIRDDINMTAAVVNPPGGFVSGTVDARGCNVGVYVDSGPAKIQNAVIYGANYFGVVVNGDVNDVAVDITDTKIHDIGEVPFSGAQRGVAIYYRAQGTGTATGRISGNEILRYQKGGIVANFPGTDVQIFDNTVTGQGPVGWIAQNGIQVGYGANASVMRNAVSGNSYTGTSTVSGGIIVVGGPYYGDPYTVGTRIVQNIVTNNDIGIYLTNIAADGGAPATATNVKVTNNTISSDGLHNNYGGFGYQAGVSDVGNNDKVVNNTVSGAGYDPSLNPTAYTVKIDADPSFTNRPKVHANK